VIAALTQDRSGTGLFNESCSHLARRATYPNLICFVLLQCTTESSRKVTFATCSSMRRQREHRGDNGAACELTLQLAVGSLPWQRSSNYQPHFLVQNNHSI